MQVWDRASGCQLHAACEAAAGLVPVLAWQPNGRHLYTAQEGQQPAPGGSGSSGSSTAPGPTAARRLQPRAGQPQAPPPQAPPQLAQQQAGPPHPRVLLYERNGLAHGGFGLRGPGPVAGLTWSSDSELLAVLQAPCAGGEGAGPQGQGVQGQGVQAGGGPQGAGAAAPAEGHTWLLQVWHRSNWHWYLKLERRYSAQGGQGGQGGSSGSSGTPLVLWDDRHASRLHVVVPGAGGAGYEQLQVLWDRCISDRGTAVVVDGRQLLLTPLRCVWGGGAEAARCTLAPVARSRVPCCSRLRASCHARPPLRLRRAPPLPVAAPAGTRWCRPP